MFKIISLCQSQDLNLGLCLQHTISFCSDSKTKKIKHLINHIKQLLIMTFE